MYDNQSKELLLEDYDNFFLGVDNMAESVDFYKNVLGLPVKFDFRDKGMIGFQIGENEPAIILKDRHMFPDAESTLWFVVKNVKDTYSHLKESGHVNFMSEPYEIHTGLAVEFEDLSGNRLGITDYSKQ